MGVDYVTYLQYGVELDGDCDFWEELDDANVDCVVDGMCGEYTVIGPIIRSMDNSDCVDFTPVQTDKDYLDKLWHDYRERFMAAVGPDKWDVNWRPSILLYIHAW